MISNQVDTSENSVQYDPQALSADESFFLELFQKRDKQTINVRYTPKGIQTANLEPFINYYSEAEIFLLLESLVTKKELIKNEKGVVLLCPKCGNHANMPVLLCPKCGSTRLGKKEDIHHHECGYWGPREEFINGMTLKCPQCGVFLDFEAEEGDSGYFNVGDSYFECQDCGSSASKNNVILVCVKCNSRYRPSEASFLSSVTYSLASEEDKLKESPKIVLEQKPIQNESIQETETKIPVKTEKEVNLLEGKVSERVSNEDASQESLEIKEPEQSLGSESFNEAAEVSEELEESDDNSSPEEFDNDYFGVEFFQKSMKAVSDIFSKQRRKSKLQKDLSMEPETAETDTEEEAVQKEAAEESVSIETGLELRGVNEETNELGHEQMEYNLDETSFQQVDEHVQEEVQDELDLGVHQVLLIIEDVTTSELIIESLEEANKPINVLHVDNALAGLKELRHKYDAIIIDLELKSISYEFLLSEMEKWSITIPIIAISNEVDEDFLVGRFALDIEAVFKKKQREYKKLAKVLLKVLESDPPQ